MNHRSIARDAHDARVCTAAAGAHRTQRRDLHDFLAIVALACCGVGNIVYYAVFSLA